MNYLCICCIVVAFVLVFVIATTVSYAYELYSVFLVDCEIKLMSSLVRKKQTRIFSMTRHTKPKKLNQRRFNF